MSAQGTRANNRQRWFDHFESCNGLGISRRAYCQMHGLKLSSFQRWCRIFKGEDNRTGAAPGRLTGTPGFLPIKLIDTPPTNSGLALVATGGLRIEIAADFDSTTLRRLLSVLESSR